MAAPFDLHDPATFPVATRVAMAFNAVADELRRAQGAFPPFASPHEGYAILLEEMDELWQEVKSAPPADRDRMRAEALQVAAMAVRFLVDIHGENEAWPE
jgi:hypothetical protein